MKKMLAVIAVAAMLPAAPAAFAQDAGPFSKGRTHVIGTAGVGSAFGETYYVIGLGAQYYLVDGFGVGATFETWTGSNPGAYKITPEVKYVFYKVPAQPYLGAFYRRTYVDNLPDINSVGAKAGIHFSASRNTNVGIGFVYESYLDCRASVYRECSGTYPEVSFTVAF